VVQVVVVGVFVESPLKNMVKKIKESYYIVDYHHIDDYRCFHPLVCDIQDAAFESLAPVEKHQREEELRIELANLFRQAGWEGDGTIECFFVPPCFSRHGDDGDTSCITIYHVKQSNNGTSWLAIPNGFKFRLPEGWLTNLSRSAKESRSMSTNSTKDPRRHVFRYDDHMPDTDDLALVVLKGHLLVEEVLVELAGLVLPHSQYLEDARLRFHQLACVVKAAVPSKPNDCWQLVFSLNSLRNDLVHNLEPPKLHARLFELFKFDELAQPFEGHTIDKSTDSSLEDSERLRHVVVDCMQFLRSLIFEYEQRAERECAQDGTTSGGDNPSPPPTTPGK
jgi:hypothetical protein